MDTNYICFFTGHRDIDDIHMSRMTSLLDRILEDQYARGARVFRTGGAIGFDTVAALQVLKFKKKHPDVRLELCLPCKDQTAKWNFFSKKIYNHILAKCDKVSYASEAYVAGCMQARNRMLAKDARVCIAFYSGGGGGTAYTVSYALKNGIELINTFDLLNK